jgi:hypothetical protein
MSKKGEVWEDIQGFENYGVSNLGRVCKWKWYKVNHYGLRASTQVRAPKLIIPYEINAGIVVSMREDGREYRRFVRDLVGRAFLHAERGDRVLHRDDDDWNCEVRNLRLQCFPKRPILNPRMVDYIQRKRAEGVPAKALMVRFQVSLDLIYKAAAEDSVWKEKI